MTTDATGAGSAWPRGGGNTGRMLREKDWSATPLGPIGSWPHSLRTAVEIVLGSPVAIVMLWGDDGVMIYNDAYSQFAGGRHPRLFGSKVLEGWPEVADFNRHVLDEVGRRGGTLSFRDQPLVLHRTGQPENVWLDLDYSPLFGDDGRTAGVFAVVNETTQRWLAERQSAELLARAQASAATLQEWFEQAPGFVALLRGPSHVFEMVNKAYYQLTGDRPLLGLPVFEALPEIRDQGFDALLDDVYRSGRPFVGRGVQVQMRRASGAPLTGAYIDFVYQPLFDNSGQVSGIFVQGHDVTEQIRAAQALLDADRRKDAFLATLAHELRNPLAPIRTAAHLLSYATLAPERIAFCSAMIERQTKNMALLLDDLLDVARITHGKVELKKSRVPVAEIVEAATETARPLMDAKRHVLAVSLPADAPEVDVDALRMAQVLTNLLTNAAKYTDPGGHIRLDVTIDAGELSFEISDDGIGIAAELLPSLFEMFQQAQATIERSQGGLGIGLALSKGLVELHGGRIEARSAGAGRGATFRVTVPIGDTAAAATTPAAAAPPPRIADADRLRVVIADDNVDAARALAMVVELSGHKVHLAHDGKAALDLARKVRPEAAFIDIGMPELDGYGVAERLRAEPWGRDMLLVATTGWGQDEDKRRASAAGFDRHMTKPIDPMPAVRLLSERVSALRR